MREMTPGEKHAWYGEGKWPCGHGGSYYAGPRGGIMQNISCPTCSMMINVVNPSEAAELAYRMTHGKNRPENGPGQVIYSPTGYVPPSNPPPPTRWEKFKSFLKKQLY